MSNSPATTRDSFSLHDEIMKRKAQAVQREIELRQLARLQGKPPAPPAAAMGTSTAARPSLWTGVPAAPPRAMPRTTPTTAPRAPQPAARPAAPAKRPNPIIRPIFPIPSVSMMVPRVTVPPPAKRTLVLSPRQTQMLFGVLAAFAMFILAGLGFAVIASSGPASTAPSATLPPLPPMSAQEVLTAFQDAGVPVSNIREFDAPNDTFAANAEIQFEVYRGQDKGLFILLSYPSTQQRVPDQFKVSASPRFSMWVRTPVSNLLMLTSPETPKALRDELSVKLVQHLVAPYRPHYATATPEVTPTTNP